MRTAIITRTKNRGVLLRRALLSVANQTDTDYIHVIVNDGGDPSHVVNGLKVLSQLQQQRVKVLHIPSSIGMEAASNFGISNSESTYIAIHDDDDSWEPTFLEKTTGYLDKNSDYKGVVVRTLVIQETLYNNVVSYRGACVFKIDVNSILLADTCYENTFAPIGFLYRREVLKAIGHYDETLPVLGDWDFNLRFLTKFDIGYMQEILANYHIRTSTEMGNSVTAGASKHVEYRAVLCNKLLRADISRGQFGIGSLVSTKQVKIPRTIPRRVLDTWNKFKNKFHPQCKILKQRYGTT